MSSNKFFRFQNNNDSENINLKKFEITLEVENNNYTFRSSYPGPINSDNKLIYDKEKNQGQISIVLNDNFYPISSIWWGKDYSNFNCNNNNDNTNLNFRITTDNNKLPFVIDNNIMKIQVPFSKSATEFGVSSLPLSCLNKKFVFGKIVVLYTEYTEDSKKLVSGTKELFTSDNKYVGIC